MRARTPGRGRDALADPVSAMRGANERVSVPHLLTRAFESVAHLSREWARDGAVGTAYRRIGALVADYGSRLPAELACRMPAPGVSPENGSH
jgi:hypothetical protein